MYAYAVYVLKLGFLHMKKCMYAYVESLNKDLIESNIPSFHSNFTYTYEMSWWNLFFLKYGCKYININYSFKKKLSILYNNFSSVFMGTKWEVINVVNQNKTLDV